MEAAGLVGENIAGCGFSMQIDIHVGAGAYICGEESALLESLEGKRAEPRLRPPFPVQAGLYGRPTVVEQRRNSGICARHSGKRRRLVPGNRHRRVAGHEIVFSKRRRRAARRLRDAAGDAA